jgi:hypothetical protein
MKDCTMLHVEREFQDTCIAHAQQRYELESRNILSWNWHPFLSEESGNYQKRVNRMFSNTDEMKKFVFFTTPILFFRSK